MSSSRIISLNGRLVSAGPRDRAATPGATARDCLIVDPVMARLDAAATAVASGTISVMLMGETGSGKEVFAENIHRRSRRCDGPFVAINCAALSETLLESELFGHERGA